MSTCEKSEISPIAPFPQGERQIDNGLQRPSKDNQALLAPKTSRPRNDANGDHLAASFTGRKCSQGMRECKPVSLTHAPLRNECGWPSANRRIISRLKAGMSSGLRLVTSLPSPTTSLSTQFAPAFLRSVLSDGHEVIVRPRIPLASIRVQGPWQMAAIGFPASTKCLTNATACGSM